MRSRPNLNISDECWGKHVAEEVVVAANDATCAKVFTLVKGIALQ
jgi:hypothetical protein